MNNCVFKLIDSLKIAENAIEVLSKNLCGELDFDQNDMQGLCSIIMREVGYTKAKLEKIGKNEVSK